jgi:hypothetical protein
VFAAKTRIDYRVSIARLSSPKRRGSYCVQPTAAYPLSSSERHALAIAQLRERPAS